MNSLRVGIVPYSNARPLTHGLERVPGIELETDVPARLIERLRAKDLDVALVSSIELFQDDGYRMLPGLGVASDGAVESVLLFARCPLAEARSLSLDTSSRSGEALARIVLEEWHGCRDLHLQHDPPSRPAVEVDADLILRIGDPALVTPRDAFAAVIDLGEEWTRHTRLPFVYAVWVVRPGVSLCEHAQAFDEARAAGRAALPAIAAAAALELDLPYARLLHYLTRSIQHDLTPRHMLGLREFRNRAAALGLARGEVEISSHS